MIHVHSLFTHAQNFVRLKKVASLHTNFIIELDVCAVYIPNPTWTTFCIHRMFAVNLMFSPGPRAEVLSRDPHRSVFDTCLKALITLFINHSCLLFIAFKITKNLFIFERISDSWQVIKVNCVPSFPNCIVLLMTALFGALYHLVTWIFCWLRKVVSI